jgi:hypothetical protein
VSRADTGLDPQINQETFPMTIGLKIQTSGIVTLADAMTFFDCIRYLSKHHAMVRRSLRPDEKDESQYARDCQKKGEEDNVLRNP